MKIQIHRNEISKPIMYEALNGYTNGNVYCVLIERGGEKEVHKYPLCSIFRIVEEY